MNSSAISGSGPTGRPISAWGNALGNNPQQTGRAESPPQSARPVVERAFSPADSLGSQTRGVAPGWYGAALWALLSLVSGCTHSQPIANKVVPEQGPPTIKVSDRYSRSAVASFDAYDVATPGHILALFVLKNGTRLPMLCKLDAGNAYPIHQSVFATNAKEDWTLTAEPLITIGTQNARGIMRMHLRFADGVLISGDKVLKRIAAKPNLIRHPKN